MAKLNQDIVNIATELNVQNTFKISGAELTTTGAEINSSADTSTRLVPHTSGTLTIDPAIHSGRIIVFNASGVQIDTVLPVATGSGNIYRFIIASPNTAFYTIGVQGDDHLYGSAYTIRSDTATFIDAYTTIGDTTTSALFNISGGAGRGGDAGDSVVVTDIAVEKYQISCFVTNTASNTPFFSA